MLNPGSRCSMSAASLFLCLLCSFSLTAQTFQSAWPEDVERVWIGPEYWANRLQDWRITAGRLECVALGVPASGSLSQVNLPMRTLHLLTRQLAPGEGDLVMSVRTGLVEVGGKVSPRCAAGFLIGVGGELDYRAAALVHHSPGPDGGLFAAIDGTGAVFVRDFSQAPSKDLARQSGGSGTPKDVELRLAVRPSGGKYTLTITSHDPKNGKLLGSATLRDIEPELLVGTTWRWYRTRARAAMRGGSGFATGGSPAAKWLRMTITSAVRFCAPSILCTRTPSS